jgi:hypothetical protein
LEQTSLNLAFRYILDALPEDVPRPLSEEDWEAAPPEVAIPHAIRSLASVPKHLEDAIGQRELDAPRLHAGIETLRRSVNVLLSPKALRAIDSASTHIEDTHPWSDENPRTYFVHSACLAFTAFVSFVKFLDTRAADESDERAQLYALGILHVQSALMATMRPECMAVISYFDNQARSGGHAVYTRSDPNVDPEDPQRIMEAYWRGDQEKLAEIARSIDSNPRRSTQRRTTASLSNRINQIRNSVRGEGTSSIE